MGNLKDDDEEYLLFFTLEELFVILVHLPSTGFNRKEDAIVVRSILTKIKEPIGEGERKLIKRLKERSGNEK